MRRIDHEDDDVHREVVAALAGGGRVVPVLVAGTALPRRRPARGMQALAQRQAVSLHDETWQEDLDALVRRLWGDPAEPVEVASGVWIPVIAAGISMYSQLLVDRVPPARARAGQRRAAPVTSG
jgi:hypothetical protein